MILFAEADMTFGSLHTEAAGEAATRAMVRGVIEFDAGTTEVKADPDRNDGEHGDGDKEGAGEGGEGSRLEVWRSFILPFNRPGAEDK